MWLSNPGCSKIVEAVWERGFSESGKGILHKVEKCGKYLSWWNKNVFGNVRKELDKLGKLLLKAEVEAIQKGDNTRVRQLKKKKLKSGMIRRLLCGHRGQDYYGLGKEIKTQSTFIVVP